MGKTPEGLVKDKVKKLLGEYSGLHFDMFVPGGYGNTGLDFTGCFRGMYFVIETKAALEEPTSRQAYAMRKVRDAGGAAFVVKGGDPSTFRELREWLDRASSKAGY